MSYYWKPLKEGDMVAVVAPASSSSKEELKMAVKALVRHGLVPQVSPQIFSSESPLVSNSAKHRFDDLRRALLDKNVKAIWCLRGGYGSFQLLPFLDKMKKPRGPKLLIGLSDITSLHIFFNQKWKWPTVHGPMLGTLLSRSTKEQGEILSVIFGDIEELKYSLKPLNASGRKNRKIIAPLVGGNLTTVAFQQITPYKLQSQGSILFFEEVNERAYRLDRSLRSLEMSGLFKQARAIVFGDITGGDEPDGANFCFWAIKEWAKEQKIPVLYGLSSGHGSLRRPVPFFTKSSLQLGSRSTLIAQSNGSHR